MSTTKQQFEEAVENIAEVAASAAYGEVPASRSRTLITAYVRELEAKAERYEKALGQITRIRNSPDAKEVRFSLMAAKKLAANALAESETPNEPDPRTNR